MSEYWKSTPKYWCKHCSTFVKDTPFEKKQHEQTGRHQGQLKRFLRGIQNDHEKAAREKQKAKAEVDRLNKIVDGNASTSLSTLSQFKKAGSAPNPTASAADRKKQLQQLVDMGIAVPDEHRADMALAGDWQVLSQRKIEEPVFDEQLNKGVRKRKYEHQEEEEQAGETVVRRGWGSTTKRYPGERTDDLDALLSMNPLKTQEDGRTVKVEDELPAQIDTTTTVLAESTPPDPGPINKIPTKRESTDDPSKLKLEDIPIEPPVPIFKKRKQKVLSG